jgi:hypothetical protein
MKPDSRKYLIPCIAALAIIGGMLACGWARERKARQSLVAFAQIRLGNTSPAVQATLGQPTRMLSREDVLGYESPLEKKSSIAYRYDYIIRGFTSVTLLAITFDAGDRVINIQRVE